MILVHPVSHFGLNQNLHLFVYLVLAYQYFAVYYPDHYLNYFVVDSAGPVDCSDRLGFVLVAVEQYIKLFLIGFFIHGILDLFQWFLVKGNSFLYSLVDKKCRTQIYIILGLLFYFFKL